MTHQYGIYAHLVCNKEGDLYFEQDINSQSQVNRDEKDTRFTVLPTDRRGPVDIAWARGTKNQVALVQISGVGWDPDTATFTPFIAQAPGNIQDTEGADVIKLERQALYNQVDANSRAGQIFAILNNPIKDVTIPFAGNYSFLDIVPQSWLYVSVPASETKRQEAWASRIVLRELTLNHKPGIIQASGVFDAEAVGKYGIIIPVPDEPLDPPPPPPPQHPPDPPPNGGGTGTGLGTALRLANNHVGLTSNLSAGPSTHWVSKMGNLAGLGLTILDLILDPWRPSTTALIATSNGIYRTSDYRAASPTWEQMTAQVCQSLIHGSINKDGYFGGCFASGGAVYWHYTEDNGQTWNTVQAGGPFTVVNTPHSAVSVRAPGGVPEVMISVWRGSGSSYDLRIFKSTNGGASFSQVFSGFGTVQGTGQARLEQAYANNESGQIWMMAQSHPAAGIGGLYISFNGGASWTGIASGSIDYSLERGAFGFHTFNNNLIQAWRQHGGNVRHLWISEDGGDNWTQASETGLSGDFRAGGGFPYNEGRVYASTTDGVFYSNDKGETFVNCTGDWAWGNDAGGGHVIVPDWTE
jgi:hypothetical protein